MTNTLNVVIRARDGIKFEGEATSVSSVNPTGTFDILPSHANFICTIEKKIWLQTTQGERKEFNVENGVLHVTGDKVVVFLGIK
jgi:F0F1-type ATP synthase epsilon subunit